MTGTEPFILGALKAFLESKATEKAKESLASEITKSAWSSAAAQVKPGSFTDQVKQAIFDASGQYISGYADRHGILKVLGMMKPIWMEDIYTRVQVLGFDGIRQFLSREDMEQAYREARKRRFQAQESKKQDGLAVANEQQYVMVLGQPGAGKSTFLRRVGLEALKREDASYKHNCIPVFLELKRFNAGTVDIEQAIVKEFTTCGFPDAARSTSRLLNDGKLLILLDGLDEVPAQHLGEAMTQIQDFCDRYKHNRFIASCRTAAYRSRFRQFVDVIIADFDDEQIHQFITNWFPSKDDQELGTAEKCWQLLQQPEYKSTRELAQTPLLLTFLCLVFDDAQTFPKQRAILYKDALDILLKRWAAEKRIQRNPIYQDLTLPLEEMMLAEIAYSRFEADLVFFPTRDVVEQIRLFLANNLNAPQHVDGEAVLDAIQIQQGILVERARSILSFSHLTLQEYLTAQYIADNNLIDQSVINHLCDERWQEVFVLIAGLMRSSADHLLLCMEAVAQQCINTNNLKNLLCWTKQATEGSEKNLKPAAKRSAALFLARALDLTRALAHDLTLDLDRTLARDRAHARAHAPDLALSLDLARGLSLDLDFARALSLDLNLARDFSLKLSLSLSLKLDRDRVGEFEKIEIVKLVDLTALVTELESLQAKIPDDFQPIAARQAFEDRILRIWSNALQLNPDCMTLSDKEVKALGNYLYANKLIVRCKEAAVRVSPQVWAGIEERMLTVRDEG